MNLYFDYCATTPPHKEVVETIAEVMLTYYGNASSLHRLGVEAEQLMNQSKKLIAQTMHVDPEEIIFTSGGTESNNLAIRGVAEKYRERGHHIITTQVEHASVFSTFKEMESKGFRVTYLPVDDAGMIRIKDLEQAITNETTLVSIMHVNNEIGSIQPIKEVGELLRKYPKVLFHVDAVQSYSKLNINPRELQIDLLSGSAHKIRGPKGIGLLYKRSGVQITPQITGGSQQYNIRGGTDNVPLMIGFAKAARMEFEKRQLHVERLYELQSYLLQLLKSLPFIVLTKIKREHLAPHIVHFCVPHVRSEVLVHALEQHHIFVSARSACSSGEIEPSRVLQAIGYDEHLSSTGIRISLSPEHTKEDLKYLVEKLNDEVSRLNPEGIS